METTVKIPWSVFVEAAVKAQETRLDIGLGKPVFMKHQNYESDSEVYQIPDYVELVITT